MYISDEIIKVLEYLCDKIGITIDWTSNNVLPYLEQICEKFIKYEIGASIGWIVIAIVFVILGFILMKTANMDGLEKVIFWMVVICAVIVIGVQSFDIIECYTFPEKAIYDYINFHYNN